MPRSPGFDRSVRPKPGNLRVTSRTPRLHRCGATAIVTDPLHFVPPCDFRIVIVDGYTSNVRPGGGLPVIRMRRNTDYHRLGIAAPRSDRKSTRLNSRH